MYVGEVLVGYKGNVPETIVVKDGTVKIADNAFGECSHFSSVKKISVPKSLKEIGIVDFSSTIWYDNLPDGPIYLGNILLTYKGTMPDNTSFTVKDGTTQIRTDFFYYNSGLSAISIPNTVERVDYISKCANLKELVLPSGVKYFGGITSCPNLKKLVIPNNVTTVGECSGLNGTTVYLDSDLNKAAYYDQYSLGGGVISSGSGMFVKSVTQTSEGAISGDDVRVVLGNNVTIVDKLREGVSSVEIPEGVKIINLDAIKSSQLKSITIPSTITHIGAINNSELQYLTIRDINSWCKIDFNNSKSNSLKNATVFLNREELSHLVIPKGVITISDYAFSNCKTTKKITLPVGIVSLGKGAFNGCENVREIYVHEAVPPTVYDDASGGFPNVCKTATLYVPIGSKAAYEADKTWSVFTNIIEKNFSNFELTPPSSTALFETVYLEDWCSTNISTSSSSSKTYTFKADAGCVLEFDWYVSCEDGDLYSGDALNVELDASTILIDKGNKSGKYRCTILKEGTYTLKTIYKTNSGTIGGADAAMVYNIKILKPDVTHIENIPIDRGYKGLPNVYYDLSGRQVNNPRKGIYIVNGKKVFVK